VTMPEQLEVQIPEQLRLELPMPAQTGADLEEVMPVLLELT